jgi:hypothetical protein
MSFAALALVVAVVTTGWERHLADEGTAAHLFQLLIAGELPLIALFLLTSKGSGTRRTIGLLIAQGVAIALALGSVALFRL